MLMHLQNTCSAIFLFTSAIFSDILVSFPLYTILLLQTRLTYCLYGVGRNILRRANPLQRTLEGVSPENRDFFGRPGNGNERSECHVGPKKSII
jgi:hypothetical protein